MKNKKYSIKNSFCFIALGMLIFGACTGNFENINTPKYLPTEDDMIGDNYKLGAFFPQMQDMAYPAQQNDYQMSENLLGDVYGRYMTITNDGWLTNFATFNAPSGWVNAPFKDAFSKIYGAWTEIRKETKGEGVNYAWAQILRVASMQRITDIYGPIPYSKVPEGGIMVPYDDQETVYKHLFKDLDDAIEILTSYALGNPDAKPMAEYDQVYGGDFSKWVKFANSLKLRMALRIVYADPSFAQKKAEEAVNHAIGVITDNADNAIMEYNINPIKIMWNDYSDTRVCADIVTYMKGYEDPRMSKYFYKGNIGGKNDYFGLRAGIKIESKAWALNYSAPAAEEKDPILWLNAAEVAFLRAEGAMRKWNMGGTDEYFYNEGISLSFKQYSLGGFEAYRENNTRTPASYDDPYFPESAISTITIKWNSKAEEEEKLERIITQKWIAMWPLGQEAWSEQRRTGYPRFFPVKVNKNDDASLTTKLASRIPFPPSEKENNLTNYNQAVTLLGGTDNYSTKLWWDKKSNKP